MEDDMSNKSWRGAVAASALSAAVFAALSATAPTAPAQDYPWCANLRNGIEMCTYSTQAQCQASVGGHGGFCFTTSTAGLSSYAAEPRRRRK
jgi:hypothetical protein